MIDRDRREQPRRRRHEDGQRVELAGLLSDQDPELRKVKVIAQFADQHAGRDRSIVRAGGLEQRADIGEIECRGIADFEGFHAHSAHRVRSCV